MKMREKKVGGGCPGSDRRGGGGQGGCEPRMEVIVKMQNKVVGVVGGCVGVVGEGIGS